MGFSGKPIPVSGNCKTILDRISTENQRKNQPWNVKINGTDIRGKKWSQERFTIFSIPEQQGMGILYGRRNRNTASKRSFLKQKVKPGEKLTIQIEFVTPPVEGVCCLIWKRMKKTKTGIFRGQTTGSASESDIGQE